MFDSINLAFVAATQCLPFVPQKTERVLEKQVMDDEANANDFNEILETNIAISLCGLVELIGGIASGQRRLAVDLACGPGHFTIMLAKYLGYEQVIGVDLSAPMLQKAKQNVREQGLEDRVTFLCADATACGIDSASTDLVTCTNSAHHLPTSLLPRLLQEMDRLSSKHGLGVLMDLTRMKLESATKAYVSAMGGEYSMLGLDHLREDFYNSMRAAFTEEQMREAIPSGTNRNWTHLAISPIPINQFLISSSDCLPAYLTHEWSQDIPLPDRLVRKMEMYRSLLNSTYKKRRSV